MEVDGHCVNTDRMVIVLPWGIEAIVEDVPRVVLCIVVIVGRAVLCDGAYEEFEMFIYFGKSVVDCGQDMSVCWVGWG